jgi:uncharacterized protein YdaU (DUF1376 family)
MSQRDVPEWMPLYVYEFIADRNVQAMELDELGAYFRLILTQWVNGSVPADRRELARLLHLDAKTMERVWLALAPCYKAHPDLPGELVQGRVEEERAVALSKLRGNSKGGKTAAERRRARQAERVSGGEEEQAEIADAPVAGEDQGFDPEVGFQCLWNTYPTKGRVNFRESRSAYGEQVRDARTHDSLMGSVLPGGKFAVSEKWSKGFVRALPGWLNDRAWENENPEPVGGENAGGPVYRKWEPPKPTE